LNGEAAALLMRHPKEYEGKVKGATWPRLHAWQTLTKDYPEYVQRFATKEAADAATDGNDDDADEEMSDMGSISDDEMAGHMELWLILPQFPHSYHISAAATLVDHHVCVLPQPQPHLITSSPLISASVFYVLFSYHLQYHYQQSHLSEIPTDVSIFYLPCVSYPLCGIISPRLVFIERDLVVFSIYEMDRPITWWSWHLILWCVMRDGDSSRSYYGEGSSHSEFLAGTLFIHEWCIHKWRKE
jgi:hypothetical protein